MTRYFGRSQAQLDRTARAFGQPTGSPHDDFFSAWSALQMRILLCDPGPEREQLTKELMAYQDHFFSRSH